MKCEIIASIILLLSSFLVIGQTNFVIIGVITDSSSFIIESGNIIFLDPIDSTVIKGAPFWDGKFEVIGIQKTEILLKITAFGYEDYFELKNFKISDGQMIDIGDVILKLNIQTLEGVQVVYTKPMFERKLGKLIVNVEGTILSEKGKLY